MAPAYANIFMGRLEGQLLRSVSLKPFSWFRFIDDVDMKWTHGPENLEIFLQEANSFHPTIRFTTEVSNEEHVFLDTNWTKRRFQRSPVADWSKRRFQRSPVAEHFYLQNHDFNSHVSLCCIDHDAQWSDDTRKARKSYWIRRLNTIQPHGINKGD